MASTEKAADPETGKYEQAEVPTKAVEPLPPPLPPPRPAVDKYITLDVALRVLLFATTLTSLLVMVTSKQTELVAVPRLPFAVRLEAKFNQSPAFIYFVVAMAVVCFYSILTLLASTSVILKPAFSTGFLLFFVIWDVVALGVVASATGAAGGVGYVALKGNSHANWGKVCKVYDNFCRHLGGSLGLGLVASFVLVFLIILSVSSLHKRIPK